MPHFSSPTSNTLIVSASICAGDGVNRLALSRLDDEIPGLDMELRLSLALLPVDIIVEIFAHLEPDQIPSMRLVRFSILRNSSFLMHTQII